MNPPNLYARGQHITFATACETAGAASTRSSLRPLISREGLIAKLRARRAARRQTFICCLKRDREPSTSLPATNANCARERSDAAIQLATRRRLDCFAALAMTETHCHAPRRRLSGLPVNFPDLEVGKYKLLTAHDAPGTIKTCTSRSSVTFPDQASAVKSWQRHKRNNWSSA